MQPRRLSPKLLSGSAALLSAVVATLAVALVTQAAHATAPARAAAHPRCATSGLVVWLNTQGNGAAGSAYYELELTNLSGHACTLHGFPGVSAVNLASQQLGRAASRESEGTPHTVTLSNGASATATLRIVAAGNFPASACRQTKAAGLRVFPPGQSSSKVIPFPFDACSRRGLAYLSVRAVR